MTENNYIYQETQLEVKKSYKFQIVDDLVMLSMY